MVLLTQNPSQCRSFETKHYKLRNFLPAILRILCSRHFPAACVLCQTILPRIRDHGLYLREVLELVWTLYMPIGCEISWYTEIDYGTITNACWHLIPQGWNIPPRTKVNRLWMDIDEFDHLSANLKHYFECLKNKIRLDCFLWGTFYSVWSIFYSQYTPLCF